MTPSDIQAALEADVKKTEQDLKAKKLLLKQVKRKPSKPFIETKFGRGLNHTVVFITNPCAVSNRNAKMRLDHPRAYRAEVTIQKAERFLARLKKIDSEPNKKTNRMAAMAALYETMLSEFVDLEAYQDKIQDLRQNLVLQVQRLRMPSTGPVTDQANSVSELLEKLKGSFSKGSEPTPEGA